MTGHVPYAIRRQEEENAARLREQEQARKYQQEALRRSAEVEVSLAAMRDTVDDAPDWELEALERLAVGMMEIVGAEIAKRKR